MENKFQRKLHRLGVVKGIKGLKSPPRPVEITPPPAPPATLPGIEVPTAHGPVWVDRRVYDAAYRHGTYALGDVAQCSVDALALLGEAGLGARPLFLDTETTGLAGGAGTLVFLTGVALWDEAQLTLHQVFLRDPAEEPAALHYLADVLASATGLVTFNGRGFDVPLLQNRFILNRLPPQWTTRPHLDLLSVARQLWRDHLPLRRLGELETHILGVTRAETDIDSALIPEMYVNYLRTGATGDMARIFYHNLVDVLSLVTLLTHTARMAAAPEPLHLAAGEWAGMGRVYDRAGREADALAAWERALSGDAGDLDPACAARLWREIGARHRRAGAWESACAAWEAWAARLPLDVEPLIERAKYDEWTARDLDAALAETIAALERASQQQRGPMRTLLIADLRHRQERLERKRANERISEKADQRKSE
ncbi:MAG TPA: ribonuclease H-like domain-containing protein [Anaerolineae bacterium]|nr:ribonuclease H-like domain-containing protein [Anaerolineae bacterium]